MLKCIFISLEQIVDYFRLFGAFSENICFTLQLIHDTQFIVINNIQLQMVNRFLLISFQVLHGALTEINQMSHSAFLGNLLTPLV